MAEATQSAAQNTEAATGGDQSAAGSTLMTTAPTEGAGQQAQASANAADSTGSSGEAGATEDKGQTDNKDGKAQGAPEKYELKAPEGFTFDEKTIADFEPVARELNLTNEQAQKIAEWDAKRMAEITQRQQEQWGQTTAKWVDDVKADPEIGGENLDTSVRHAQAALKKFGTPTLKAQMDATGMGNHPELVRVFARIGKAMAEDTFVSSSVSGDGQMDPAKKLFPGMN